MTPEIIYFSAITSVLVLLVGGSSVPADVEWLDGDILSVETGM